MTSMLDEAAAGARVRVLFIEDDVDDHAIVRAMLRAAGDASVLTVCERIDEAIEPLSRGLTDLVLLDLALPDASGLEGLRRVRAAAPEIPVVVLSGAQDEALALRAVQAGAQDFLMKGAVDAVTLSRAIRYALERQRAEQRLTRMALRDPLTGLPNRSLFADRLEQAVARRARGEEPLRLVLLFIDLNGFKTVNDRFGHLAGDELLVEVGQRLRAELRGADTVARLGGDEFTVLCDGLEGPEEARALARRIAVSLGRPYLLSAGSVEISAAVGVTLAAPSGEDPASLLRRADAAMYQAKAAGPGISVLSEDRG